MAAVLNLTPELKERVRTLLAKLASLSEAPSGGRLPGDERSGPGIVSGHVSESQPPRGFSWDNPDPIPDPDRYLLDWFVWRMGKVRSEPEARAVITETEFRLERRKKRSDSQVAGSFGSGAAKGSEAELKSRDKRIGTGYPSLAPEEVAVVESFYGGHVTSANVRKTRLAHDRDPESGERLPAERKLRGEERVRRAKELRADGLSTREIGKLCGVSHTTVAYWLAASHAGPGNKYVKSAA